MKFNRNEYKIYAGSGRDRAQGESLHMFRYVYICVDTCIYMCTYLYSWREYLHEFKRNDYTYTHVMVGTVHMLSNYICVHIFIYVCTCMYIWREFKMNKFAYTPVVGRDRAHAEKVYTYIYMYVWREYIHEFKKNENTYTQVVVGTVHTLSNYMAGVGSSVHDCQMLIDAAGGMCGWVGGWVGGDVGISEGDVLLLCAKCACPWKHTVSRPQKSCAIRAILQRRDSFMCDMTHSYVTKLVPCGPYEGLIRDMTPAKAGFVRLQSTRRMCSRWSRGLLTNMRHVWRS